MPDFTLSRSGQRPLAFNGEELESHSSFAGSGPGNLRWWTISVFKTDADQYVLALRWNTRWQGESDETSATAHASLDDLAAAIESHDPLCHLIGFPVSLGGKYADRQRHIETVLRQQWQGAVSKILSDLGVAERI